MKLNAPHSRGWKIRRHNYKSGNVGFDLTSPPIPGLYDKAEQGRRHVQTFGGSPTKEEVRALLRNLVILRRLFCEELPGMVERRKEVSRRYAEKYPGICFDKPTRLAGAAFFQI